MTQLTKENIELLAPVGHFEGLKAAIANGADAIYVGGPSFGARKTAAFTYDELLEVITFSHLHNVRVYVTINTTIFDDEIDEITNYIHFLYINGADAVIVQDLGIVKLIRQLYPDFQIHISTQMHIHNTSGVRLAKEIGATRVVIARESSLAATGHMVGAGLEIEAFVHGALCFSYSGQCLMSSMIGGRSGNRGACGQPCRLSYQLVNLKTIQTLPSVIGDYHLSPKDLKTVDDVGEMIEAGITSFKIEGRLKKPAYVAATVRAYRMAIDQYLSFKQINLAKHIHQDLARVFSRGFTKGFLHGEDHRHWIGADGPGHRGEHIGVVVATKKNRATVKLNGQLDLHDGVRFIGAATFGMDVQKMFVNLEDVNVATDGLVDLICNFTPQVGMDVYKTTSATLEKEFAAQQIPKIPIEAEVIATPNQPLRLTIWDSLGNVTTHESHMVAQLAEQTGLSSSRLAQQLEKTGNSPFNIRSLSIKMDQQVIMPISAINKLRREALLALEEKRKNWYEQRKLTNELPEKTVVSKNAPPTPMITVSVCQIEQLRAVCEHPEIKEIYYKDVKTLSQAVTLAGQSGKKLIPQLSRIIDEGQISKVVAVLKALDIQTVLVGEYGMLHALKGEFEVITDDSIHANNGLTLQALADLGVSCLTASYEVTGAQIKKLAKNSPLPLEVIAFGRVPLMITKHCPLKAHYQSNPGPCGMYCQTPHGLKNRKGKIMPIVKREHCHIEILDHQHVILLEKMKDLMAGGVGRFRLAFTTETSGEINEAITAFTHMRKHLEVDAKWLKKYDYTLGHYNRGIRQD